MVESLAYNFPFFVEKMDFKASNRIAVKSKEGGEAGTPKLKKRSTSRSKFEQPKEESPAPTPKLKKKKAPTPEPAGRRARVII